MSTNIPPITGPGGNPTASLIPAWQPTATYAQGAVVIPTSQVPKAAAPLPDSNFASGTLSSYASSGGWTIASGNPFSFASGFSNYMAQLPASAGATLTLISTTRYAVIPNQIMTAGAYFDGNCTDLTQPTYAYVVVFWYNASNVLIGQTLLNNATTNSFSTHTGFPPPGQSWPTYYIQTLVATAPASAAFASIGVLGNNTSATQSINCLGLGWIYSTPGTSVAQTPFTAIQLGSGTSGAVEPVWPGTGTIQDNTVTWEAGVTSVIQWQTIAPNTSSTVEPVWPTTVGALKLDNTMYWSCQTPGIVDPNCPASPYVVSASSKIFAGDNDIVRFSATTNPTDWTSEADAGFLPTGLQSYGANPVTALGIYRSNLVVFNSQGLQMWQIDEDPANMSLLDAIPIGTTYQRALSPVNNDLFFLSPQGVRTMGISVASSNLVAGDVGMPIDLIVQAARVWADANGVDPIATYFPSAGQYWLAFPGWPDSGFFQNPGSSQTTNVFVYTMNRVGEVGAWSRYLFPFVIENFCQNGNDLYIRCNTVGQTGSDIVKVDFSAMQDFSGDTHGRAAYFTWVVQWPWLDFGTTGTTKKLDGLDVVATSTGGTLNISVGYDQSNTARMTTPFAISSDSLPGNFIPIALMAPSFSVSLTSTSQYDWQIQAVNAYLQDQRITA